MNHGFHASSPFTVIRWAVVDLLDVSLPEYALLDVIHGLSLKTGWCYASRAELAARVRMKPRWVFKQLAELSRKGLVETDPHTRWLKPTAKWTDVLAAERTNPPAGKAEALPPCEETYAPNAQGCVKKAAATRTRPVRPVHTASAQKTQPAVHGVQPDYAPDAHNNNSYKYRQTGQEQDIGNGVDAPEGFGSASKPREKTPPLAEEAAMPVWELPEASPPPVVAAPPDKPGPARPAQKPKVGKPHAVGGLSRRVGMAGAPADTEPCLAACRAAYLRHFPDYGWQYGRDDRLLKGVLAQIRAKIALRQEGEASEEYVVHSLESLLQRIPDWYRRNGHTTPGDLNRHFEKHYAAIKAGQGGSGSPHLAPATDRDREYLHLMRMLDE